MNIELIREIISKPILHLNARDIEQFPLEFYEYCQHTFEIYLRWNKICFLPPWINKLINLTNLYLSYNHLVTLPEEMSQLENLQVLIVNNNQLVTLPSSVGNLKNLTFLDVSMNKLSYLPQGMCELNKLQILVATNNKLEFLPEQLGKCQALEELNLANNKILFLPRSIVYLPFLNYLNLAYNNLFYLPAIPFITTPQINIQSNPNLVYGSFQILYQVFPNTALHLKDNRCNLWQIVNENCSSCIQIQTLCSEKTSDLFLPQELSFFTNDLSKHHIPSLLELCTRNSYNMYHQLKKICGKSEVEICKLPCNLTNTLKQGPLAQCFEPACQIPIFHEAIGWLIHTNFTEIKHGILFFCSTHCALKSLYVFFSKI